jgi:hypothetical protein
MTRALGRVDVAYQPVEDLEPFVDQDDLVATDGGRADGALADARDRFQVVVEPRPVATLRATSSSVA